MKIDWKTDHLTFLQKLFVSWALVLPLRSGKSNITTTNLNKDITTTKDHHNYKNEHLVHLIRIRMRLVKWTPAIR